MFVEFLFVLFNFGWEGIYINYGYKFFVSNLIIACVCVEGLGGCLVWVYMKSYFWIIRFFLFFYVIGV